jgi:tetratricopeptide (TPR) repeat protein
MAESTRGKGAKVLAILCALVVGSHAAPLPEVYREAKAALEAGDPAKAVSLLEPALASPEGDETQRALASLALGLAYLRTDKAAAAIPALEKAAARWAGTPDAANALAPLADALRKADRADDARRAYAQAAELAATSPLGRYAKARLDELTGESLATEKQFPKAAASFLAAADVLLALGTEDPAYFADARALYTKVAQGKEWRGEPTARAVFSLGEVERAQGNLPEAIAYYQRTFVTWLRYPHWCAQAYLRAADCMDQLGKRDFAIRHLREMVRKVEKFGTLPEYQEAKKKLRAWGEKVQ